MTINTLSMLANLHKVRWAVSLVIVDGCANFPQGFVWVCMGKHTHFITNEGSKAEDQN